MKNGEDVLKLRKATLADAKMLFDWRNDPVTRANSFTHEELVWENHVRYIHSVVTNQDVGVYIAEYRDKPVGTVRYVKKQEIYDLSWTVAPDNRGRGFGRKILELLIGELPPGIQYTAQVMAHNKASQIMALAAGMQLQKNEMDIFYYFGSKEIG